MQVSLQNVHPCAAATMDGIPYKRSTGQAVKYVIRAKTPDLPLTFGEGTDASVTFLLFGSLGAADPVTVAGPGGPFEPNSITETNATRNDVGEMRYLHISVVSRVTASRLLQHVGHCMGNTSSACTHVGVVRAWQVMT